MSGGKGGSTTSKVEIPAWAEAAAQKNLQRAEGVQNLGYTPYIGPDVAAPNQMQTAAWQSAADAGSAFGLAPKMDVAASLPEATDYGNGIKGYSSFPLFEQAVSEFRQKYPDQATYMDRYSMPTRTPIGGTANYEGPNVLTEGQNSTTGTGDQTTGVPPATTGTTTDQGTFYGGTGQNTTGTGTTGTDAGYGGGYSADPFASLGTTFNYKKRGNENFINDVKNNDVKWEKIRFTAGSKDEALKQAEQTFVNEMGLFKNVGDMRDYLSIVKAGDGNYRFEFNNGGGDLVKYGVPLALAGLGAAAGGLMGAGASAGTAAGTGAVSGALSALSPAALTSSGLGTVMMGNLGATAAGGLLGYGAGKAMTGSNAGPYNQGGQVAAAMGDNPYMQPAFGNTGSSQSANPYTQTQYTPEQLAAYFRNQ